jgi:hypothetical protein
MSSARSQASNRKVPHTQKADGAVPNEANLSKVLDEQAVAEFSNEHIQ